jgi:hypothetical protein
MYARYAIVARPQRSHCLRIGKLHHRSERRRLKLAEWMVVFYKPRYSGHTKALGVEIAHRVGLVLRQRLAHREHLAY